MKLLFTTPSGLADLLACGKEFKMNHLTYLLNPKREHVVIWKSTLNRLFSDQPWWQLWKIAFTTNNYFKQKDECKHLVVIYMLWLTILLKLKEKGTQNESIVDLLWIFPLGHWRRGNQGERSTLCFALYQLHIHRGKGQTERKSDGKRGGEKRDL